MDDLETALKEIEKLKKENELLRSSHNHDCLASIKIVTNAENIIIKAINMAYDIRVQLKTMLESMRGKEYEDGIKIIADFVSNNKHFLGNNIQESKLAAKEFVQQLVVRIKK